VASRSTIEFFLSRRAELNKASKETRKRSGLAKGGHGVALLVTRSRRGKGHSSAAARSCPGGNLLREPGGIGQQRETLPAKGEVDGRSHGAVKRPGAGQSREVQFGMKGRVDAHRGPNAAGRGVNTGARREPPRRPTQPDKTAWS